MFFSLHSKHDMEISYKTINTNLNLKCGTLFLVVFSLFSLLRLNNNISRTAHSIIIMSYFWKKEKQLK